MIWQDLAYFRRPCLLLDNASTRRLLNYKILTGHLLANFQTFDISIPNDHADHHKSSEIECMERSQGLLLQMQIKASPISES